MGDAGSETLILNLKSGDERAATALWEQYFQMLSPLPRRNCKVYKGARWPLRTWRLVH